MAFTLGDAIVKIAGEDSQLAKTLKDNEGAVKGFTQRAGNAIRGAFGTAMKVGLAAVVTGVVAIGTMALSTENQFITSQNNIQSALGVTEDRAEQVGQVMRDVWGNNFGNDVADVEQAITDVALAMERVGGVSDEQLGKSTEDAFRLRDAYGIGINESVSAATTLMDTFGLTADQAFDFLTKGQQKGLNANGDFLESVGEYSNLFADAGGDAGQFFSLMETGMAGGMLGTDKAADAFKEFQIRFLEGGEDMQSAIETLTGDGWGMFMEEIQAGDNTVADSFGLFTRLLGDVEDPIERNRLAIALMGTQAEDLGLSFVDGLSLANTSLEDMAGATDTLNKQYENWPSFFEGIRREGIEALTPLTDKLLTMANDAMPDIKEAFSGFIDQLVEAMPDIIAFVDKVVEFAADHGGTILKVLGAMGIAFGVLAIVTSPVILAVLAIGAAVALLSTAWSENWGGIQEKTATAVEFIKELVGNFVAAVEEFWAVHGETIIATVNGFIETIQTGISEFLTAVEEFWATHGETIIETVNGFIALVEEYFEGLWEAITLAFEGFKAAFEGDWEAFGENLTLAVGKVIDAIVEFWAGLWDLVKPFLETAITNMKSEFTDVDWAAVGSQVIDGIKNGLNNAKEALYATMKGIASGAMQAAREILKINSPSRAAEDEIGEPVVQGIERPLQAGRSRIAQAMRDLVQLPNGLASQAAGALGGGGTTNNNRNTTIEGDRVVINTNANAADVANAVDRRRRAKLELRYGY